MAADHQVDIGNLFGNLHIFVITCVTDCNQNVDPFLFETLGFLTDALNFVENPNSIGAGDVLKKKQGNQFQFIPVMKWMSTDVSGVR